MSMKSYSKKNLKLVENKQVRRLLQQMYKVDPQTVKILQRVVQTKTDGYFGPRTANKLNNFLKQPDDRMEEKYAQTQPEAETEDVHVNVPHKLSQRSLKRLEGVHPDLVELVKRASVYEPRFTVLEGLRSLKTQKKYVKKGVSKTMNSLHLYGLAVDLALVENGKIDWSAKSKGWEQIRIAMERAEKDMGTRVFDTGTRLNWSWSKDLPHYQLTKKGTYGNPRITYLNNKFKGFLV